MAILHTELESVDPKVLINGSDIIVKMKHITLSFTKIEDAKLFFMSGVNAVAKVVRQLEKEVQPPSADVVRREINQPKAEERM